MSRETVDHGVAVDSRVPERQQPRLVQINVIFSRELSGRVVGGGALSKPFPGQPVGGVNQAHLPIAHVPSGGGRDWFQLDSQELSSLGNEFAKLVMPEPSPLFGLLPPFHECR